ncbi:MAG: ABC transporter permease [Dysgonamonadaceae bacterium]|jgi:ABC-type antimicrobial peptide transport system permease subunit|nr:ABC transporter permease [Dysgonamonadaceae bacterium]
MFYNLKIAIRNLRHNGLYSFINIFGLAISLTACILITLWVMDELNRNKFLKNADQIYELNHSSPGKLGPLIERKIPEVIHVCRILNNVDPGILSSGATKFTETKVCLADTSFFSLFSFNIVESNSGKIFEDKHSAVISESLSMRIFNTKESIGKTIQSDTYGIFHITAVMEDAPKNSTLQYEIILPFSLYPDVARKISYNENEDWGNFYFSTYVMIAEAVNPKITGEKISRTAWNEAYPDERYSPGCYLDFSMRQLTTSHLYAGDGSPTGIKDVRLFSIAAFLLLLIAAINYVNLVTARQVKKSKEINIRRTLGSSRLKLFGQIMSEALLTFIIALLSATILLYLLLPFYNNLTGKQLSPDFFSPEIWIIYLSLVGIVVLLAGFYPAFKLSSLKFARLSNFQSGKHERSFFRKILVVFQFVLSSGLIVCTIVLGYQLDYMKEKDPGYTRENIFVLPLHHMQEHHPVVKEELTKQAAIADVTFTTSLINNVRWNVVREQQCKDGLKKFPTSVLIGDYNMIDFFNIPIRSGRKFTMEDHPLRGFIINKRMADELGWDDFIGRTIPLFSENQTRIIGEISDFNFKSFHQEISPMVIIYGPEHVDHIYVKSCAGKEKQAIAAVEKIWKRYNEGYPFEYQFLDESFDKMYKSDIRTGNLFNSFAVIAIFVSCLGLFGLVTHTAETKTKEIGIRKILGASVSNIVNMLSKEFLILVGIAMFIAFPLAWYWLDRMLQDYAYRISISWWMFALAGLITIVLTLLTVGWQAIKAATANPVQSISRP